MDKTCLMCEHFFLSMGDGAYSDVTPSLPASVGCWKGHWELESESGEQKETFRSRMKMADRCRDYKKVEV